MCEIVQSCIANRADRRIDDALLAAMDLRDTIFEIGDEPLIHTMDLLVYALGKVATRHRLEHALDCYAAGHGDRLAKSA